ncbi:hypothetical protein JCM8097_008714 [Rhodosporidiobolus ruineniae]
MFVLAPLVVCAVLLPILLLLSPHLIPLSSSAAQASERMQRTFARLSAVLPTYFASSPSAPTSSPLSPHPTRMASSAVPAHNFPGPVVNDGAEVNTTPEEWRKELEQLPTLEQTGGAIPSIFLAHGSPMLIHPPHLANQRGGSIGDIQGPTGPLAVFLTDLGPALVEKYKPKAVVVFSAHWETPNGGGVVTDYGEENPLLMDYFGFPDELYQVKFKSSGDHAVAERVVSLLKAAGLPSRLTSKLEPRGEDGRGFVGPGLDHGVFVPFKLMFNDSAPVPIIQVSLASSLRPEDEYRLGAALEPLRSEGILLISGGLTVHTFRDFNSFSPKTAKPQYRDWERSIVEAAAVEDPSKRKSALFSLIHHPMFRAAHPREEHFIPIYTAAGAADAAGGRARTVCGLWGAKTIVFGV